MWTASAVSNLGDGIVYTAAPLLAASLTRDPFAVAFTMFMRSLPWLLFSPIVGVIVDRLDRRVLMGVFDYCRAGALGFLSVAVLFDFVNLPLLYAVFFVIGACEVFFDNTSQTILPSVVPRQHLPKANGRLEGTRIVANDLVGPSLGGLLFGVAAAVPFLINAGAFAAAAALILALGGNFAPRNVSTGTSSVVLSVLKDIREGLVWLLRRRFLLLLASMTAVARLVDEAAFAIFVLYAQDVLGLSPAGYGLLLAAGAAGGIFGSFVVDALTSRLGPTRTIFVSAVIGALSYAGIALANRTPNATVVVATMLVINGFHLASWNVTTLSLRQALVPEQLLGRINSTYRFVAMLGLTAGTLVGGTVASAFGLIAPFWLAASLLAMLAFVAIVIGRSEAGV